MPRGQASLVGTKRTANNGYEYTKTRDRGWVLTHWLVFEHQHNRQVDPTNEQIRFLDGNRNNMDAENLISVPKNTTTIRAKIARLKSKIEDLQVELAYYEKQLGE